MPAWPSKTIKTWSKQEVKILTDFLHSTNGRIPVESKVDPVLRAKLPERNIPSIVRKLYRLRQDMNDRHDIPVTWEEPQEEQPAPSKESPPIDVGLLDEVIAKKNTPPVPNIPEAFIWPTVAPRTPHLTKSKIRIIIPDSHGNHIDVKARDACVVDIHRLNPDEIIWLGDHLDCGGTFSAHQRTYTNEIAESYQADINAANEFLDMVIAAAPGASHDYLEGNHEQHVERWAARTFLSREDAELLVNRYGPASVLQLGARGIRYHKRSEHTDGISIPGCIRRGKCFFVHGISASKHAAATHLARFGANVVFGHVHRSQSVIERTVTSDGFGAWCPGTLAKLQPLYKHTEPSSWAHGYGVQFINASENFLHLNVPILDGVSFLGEVAERLNA